VQEGDGVRAKSWRLQPARRRERLLIEDDSVLVIDEVTGASETALTAPSGPFGA